MSNQFVWVDIPVSDLGRAIKFYSALLGVKVRRHDAGGRSVGLFPDSPGSVSGCLVQAQGDSRPSRRGPLIYVNCDGRVQEAEAAVRLNGGQIIEPLHILGAQGMRSVVLDSEGNRLALHSMKSRTTNDPERGFDRALENSEREIRKEPNYLMRLLELAENVGSQGHSLKAFELCRKALELGGQDPEVKRGARRLLGWLVPGYHRPMVNDTRRNLAWDKALRRAVRPGMRVLEIGTGPGMLAMMAARAGAGRVTTCEQDAVVAAIAREVIGNNGYAGSIDVLAKNSLQMEIGTDMAERADLLFCDNFSDDMFSFKPLQSIADAHARLLNPGAAVLPAASAVRLALANWDSHQRLFQMDRSADFDLSAMARFVCESLDLELGDPGIQLLSTEAEAFRFDFSATSYPARQRSEVALVADQDCVVNGIAQWIRLDLDDETFLESRPEPGATFFSNPRFYPLLEPLHLHKGDAVRVHAEHDGSSLSVWIE